jgi:hypothetical protein
VRRFTALAVVGVVVLGGSLVSAGASELAAPDKPTVSTDTPVWSDEQSATFVLSGSQNTASFICRLDSGAAGWGPCTSPVSYPSLTEGGHTFQVRALDPSGEQSPPATFSWTVDVTAPILPGDVVVEATSPVGAIVSFAATDNLDPSPGLACTQAPGSTFSLGDTDVTCTATDAAGNASAGVVRIVVRDTTPPTLTSHADVIAGQQSPQGAVVSFALPTAHDAADPSPVVTCDPASGTLFPLGETGVSCVATDASGLTSGAESFKVIVQAGAKPAKPSIKASVPPLTTRADAEFELTVEPDLVAVCRLDGPLGGGTFEPCSGGSVQTYSGLVDGAYLFTVQVTNSIGNVNQASYGWVVDRTPPAAVVGFSARAAYLRVGLTWTKPIDVDYDRVRIWRKRGTAGFWKRLVDRAAANSFTDGTVSNHVLYRYRIRSLDRAGNLSSPVEVEAWPSPIVSPRYHAVVHTPPLVDWRSAPGATYYNMQVWRDGRKILSTWPARSQYRLQSSWTFQGRRYALSQGRVAVYVWPGYGSKAAARYGPLYGRTVFTIG